MEVRESLPVSPPGHKETMIEKQGQRTWFIGAKNNHSQGFQEKVNSSLQSTGELITPQSPQRPDFCIHATNRANASAIIQSNRLSRMKRTSVSFCTSLPGSVLQKTQTSQLLKEPIWIFLDVEKVVEHGLELRVFDNDVAQLTPSKALWSDSPQDYDSISVRDYVLDVWDIWRGESLITGENFSLRQEVNDVLNNYSRLLDEGDEDTASAAIHVAPGEFEIVETEAVRAPTQADLNKWEARGETMTMIPCEAKGESTVTASADDVISLKSTSVATDSYCKIPSEGSLITLPESNAAHEIDLNSSDSSESEEGYKKLRKYGPSGNDPVQRDVTAEPLPPSPAGPPISYGPDMTPQRPKAPLRGSVRLEPIDELQSKQLAENVSFVSEYDRDISEGWKPVKQRGYIVQMVKMVNGNEETKDPGRGNPNPPKRSRSLSLSRDSDKSASAPPVFDRATNVFEYPDGCVPAPIRTERSRKPPPEPIMDIEIRPGEWVWLKRSLGRQLIFEPQLPKESSVKEPFLDWSSDRIVPCDSCRLHLAPVCSRCQISTCFNCSKLLQSWKSQDPTRAGLPYLVACTCQHKYKLRENRERSPFTSEETDMAWDLSGGHKDHCIHPREGLISSPCGRTGPSRKHRDCVPRLVQTGTWEDRPIQRLCQEPQQVRPQRSRSPPRSRNYDRSDYSDAPWRQQPYTADLKPARGAVSMRERLACEARPAVRLDKNEVFPQMKRSKSSPHQLPSSNRPPSPQRKEQTGSRKREGSVSFQTMKAGKRVTLEERLSDDRRQGLVNLQDNTGDNHLKKGHERNKHLTPSATTNALANGKVLIEWYPENEVTLAQSKELNKSSKDVRVSKRISHSHCKAWQAKDADFVREVCVKVFQNNFPGGLTRRASAPGESPPCRSTLQLGVFCSNMGDMVQRHMYLAGEHQVQDWLRKELQPMFRLWAGVTAQIWVTNEIDCLNTEEGKALLSQAKLKGIIATPPANSRCTCPGIGCHIKDIASATVTQLDSLWVPWSDQSDKGWTMGGAIFRVVFGTEDDSYEPCHRALREDFVLGCFHINNEAAKKSTKARTAFLQFLRLCVQHKADFIGGDANMAANIRQNGQVVADRENSICAVAMRQTQLVFNKNKELWERLSVYPVEGEGMETFLHNCDDKSSAPSQFDSMVAWVLSWSKDIVGSYRRQELADMVIELRQIQREQQQQIAQGYNPQRRLSVEEEELLEKCHRIRNYYGQFHDTHVTVSEFCKTITKQSMFLEDHGRGGNEGGGWHNPLLVTIRLSDANMSANKRIRQKDGKRKNPFGEIKKLLGLTALSAKIVPTEAFDAPASDTCAVSASAEPDWKYQLVLFIMAVSFTLNVIFILFGKWIFTRRPMRDEPAPEPMPLNYMLHDLPAAEQEQEVIALPNIDIIPEDELCTTPGCARRRNIEDGYTTCCRYCPETHSHSYQCNHRNGIPLRVQHDENGQPQFPEGAAPQFDQPFRDMANDLQEVQEVLRTRGAPQRQSRHLLIPRDIGILPTGQRYHFWPNCQHMQRARLYSVCGTCLTMARQVMPVVTAYDFPGHGPASYPAPEAIEVHNNEELVVQ